MIDRQYQGCQPGSAGTWAGVRKGTVRAGEARAPGRDAGGGQPEMPVSAGHAGGGQPEMPVSAGHAGGGQPEMPVSAGHAGGGQPGMPVSALDTVSAGHASASLGSRRSSVRDTGDQVPG